jgi:membrane AbrB-like protein
MNEFTGFRARLPHILKALVVGMPAGAFCDWLDTPIPWMIGPMITVAAINLSGMKVAAMPYSRQAGQMVIGAVVSLYFTPTMVAALTSHLGAIAAGTASAFMIGGLGALVLSRVSGIDTKSAFFSSTPGGAMAMVVLAERAGASIPPVAVAHSLRVSIVVIVLPFALTYGDIPMDIVPYKPSMEFSLGILIVWFIANIGVGWLAEKARVQNGYMLAPIVLGAVLLGNGVPLSTIPHWIVDAAQLIFGIILGTRFERAFFARHRMFIPFAVVNALFIIAASAGAAIFIAWAFGMDPATIVIATAPGGMPEMTIVAQALGISVPLVISFHLFRVFFVALGTQYIYAAAMWLLARRRRSQAAE